MWRTQFRQREHDMAHEKHQARWDEANKRLRQILERMKRGEAKLPSDSPEWQTFVQCR